MIKMGIIGCSDIAFRRFMPAIEEQNDVKVVAVAEEYDTRKLPMFCNQYGIEGMDNYEALILRDDIDAVYIPQPPALHYKWAKLALESDKHVLVEKPATISAKQTEDLIQTAEIKRRVLHENYMFQYHIQIDKIKEIVESGEIGEIRLVQANFGFPLRQKNDFRYLPELGGGAIMDAAGYTIKIATILLGNSIKVDAAHINMLDDYDVDMYGTATLSNDQGVVCQVGYGMDNSYQCSLKVWGSKKILLADRVFTAPADLPIKLQLFQNGEAETILLPCDSSFKRSIEIFKNAIYSDELREKLYGEISKQAQLMDEIQKYYRR